MISKLFRLWQLAVHLNILFSLGYLALLSFLILFNFLSFLGPIKKFRSFNSSLSQFLRIFLQKVKKYNQVFTLGSGAPPTDRVDQPPGSPHQRHSQRRVRSDQGPAGKPEPSGHVRPGKPHLGVLRLRRRQVRSMQLLSRRHRRRR